MDKVLCSVGLDVGTTTTQLIVSRITARNQASGFTVPRMEITDTVLLYQSPIHFTPLLSGELVDGAGIRAIVQAEYEKAGIRPEDVDTGAIIITGETSRKRNAEAVLQSLSDYAGDFVVATAGPELESVLAAQGAGAVEASRETDNAVLHMDIGGGTSNLALCRDGKIMATGCLNVGGRLLKFDDQGRITYVSPVLEGITSHKVGDIVTEQQAMETARLLAGVLEMAAGLKEKTPLFSQLTTGGTQPVRLEGRPVLSFSGGVADCIASTPDWLEYGDLGPLLGQAIRESALCKGPYRLGKHTIRATVIGAGCHSMQLSGSTVFCRGFDLPAKNLPVAHLTLQEQSLPQEALTALIRSRLEALEPWGVLSLTGWTAPGYTTVTALADAIAGAVGRRPCLVALEADMAKALGHALALRLDPDVPCLCLDGLHIPPQSYLDVGDWVGPAITVVVKTLVFEQ